MTKQVHSHIILCDYPSCSAESEWVVTKDRNEKYLGFRLCDEHKRHWIAVQKEVGLPENLKTVFKHEIRRFGSNDG